MPLVALTRFFERIGLQHELAESGPDRLVYVLAEDMEPAQLEPLLEEALGGTYALACEQADDNRLSCTLSAPAAESTGGGADGD